MDSDRIHIAKTSTSRKDFDQLLEELENKATMSALTSLQIQRLPEKIPITIYVTIVWKTFIPPPKITDCSFKRAHDNTYIVEILLKQEPLKVCLLRKLTEISKLCRDEVPLISGLESLDILTPTDYPIADVNNTFSDDDSLNEIN